MSPTGSPRSMRDSSRAKLALARAGESARAARRSLIVSMLLGLLAAAPPVLACYKMPIAGTGFSVAEQVKYKTRSGVSATEEPAVILGAAGAGVGGSPAVRVVLLNSDTEKVVTDVKATLSKLNERFAPGDAIKRAMLSGDEEDATVVRVDSPTSVTIRILPNGPTYASDIKRLRKPAAVNVAAVDVAALQQKLAAKFPELAPSARPNPHAAPGTPLHSRFAAAAKDSNKVVDIMVHGTPEQNVDSILKSSLRMIAFAVLRDKSQSGHIVTTTDAAHHLPLFEAEYVTRYEYDDDYY